MPGERWYRYDPRTGESVDLGSGIRVDPRKATYDIDYFISGQFALAGFSYSSGCFYQFSDTPAQLLAVHATEKPLPGGIPVPPEGAIERSDGITRFYCGEGALAFSEDEGRFAHTLWLPPYKHPTEASVARQQKLQALLERLSVPEERKRVGVTPEQMQRIEDATRKPRSDLDRKRLETLFAAFRATRDSESEKEAAKPLLAEARDFGENTARQREAYIRDVTAALTPRQWKLLAYEPLGPDDAAGR